MKEEKSYEELLAELEEMRAQLHESTETIEAIRSGQVDAFVVKDDSGHQLYTLKSADQTYRVIIENMNEAALTLDRKGIILYANTSFAKLVGSSLSQVIGKQFDKFITEDNKDDFTQLINEGWAADTKSEQYIKGSDGQSIPVLVSLKTLQLDSSTALSIIMADLSIQKENERQLKAKQQQLEASVRITARLNEGLEAKVLERTRALLMSKDHFKFLADNIPVIVWTALPDGKIDYYNKRWYEFTGSSVGVEDGWEKVIHPDDLDACMAAWLYSVATGTPYNQDCRYLRASDNSYRWHYANALPFRNDQGNIVAWFGISTDMDDQKKAMQKKDDFISVVSHELKTPLTSVKAYIQLMKAHNSTQVPAQVSLYIDKANDNVRKLEFLINDLLDVSKVQSGKFAFNVTRLSINELINECISSARILYPAFQFSTDASDEFFVDGNRERLEQVIMNLFNNAVKYSPSTNTVKIKLSRNHEMVRVNVIDAGIGLTEEQQLRIFDRFYRAQNVTAFYGGLGMGLYISSEIVKQHDGNIGVMSKVNEGSTFYFELPVVN